MKKPIPHKDADLENNQKSPKLHEELDRHSWQGTGMDKLPKKD